MQLGLFAGALHHGTVTTCSEIFLQRPCEPTRSENADTAASASLRRYMQRASRVTFLAAYKRAPYESRCSCSRAFAGRRLMNPRRHSLGGRESASHEILRTQRRQLRVFVFIAGLPLCFIFIRQRSVSRGVCSGNAHPPCASDARPLAEAGRQSRSPLKKELITTWGPSRRAPR